MKHRTYPEEVWVEKIRNGDAAAFEALFRAYYIDLHSAFRRFADAPEDAEEMIHDVFINIWRQRQQWSPLSIEDYLYGAVRNHAYRYLRRRNARRQLVSDEEISEEIIGGESPDVLFERQELEIRVVQVLQELPEQRRLIYNLSRQHGLTYKEIAAILNISVKTVETQMSRALRFLRERLSTLLSILL